MKKLDKAALQMQKLAGIITESEYNTEMAKMNKMEAEDANMDNTPKMEAEEDSSVEDILSKYEQPLLKALKARQMDQESEEAHDMVESLMVKIATELGYPEANEYPWMEDEMLSGDYTPQEVFEYLKDMFTGLVDDLEAGEAEGVVNLPKNIVGVNFYIDEFGVGVESYAEMDSHNKMAFRVSARQGELEEVSLEEGLRVMDDYVNQFSSVSDLETEFPDYVKSRQQFEKEVSGKVGKFYIWAIEYDTQLMFIEDSAASMNEMNKMKRTPKMEAEDANMNTYKVERVGPTHTEEMVESPLNIADFSKEMLENYKAEGLTDEFAFARPEAALGVENSSDWMVSISEDLAYAISQVDSAASMNEMNKMKRKSRM